LPCPMSLWRLSLNRPGVLPLAAENKPIEPESG
jgi:hypothetical protein